MFFFKQKTAYELRIRDWSSDVGSSDLLALDTGKSIEALSAASYPGEGTVAEKLTSNIATIGEQQALRRARSIEVGEGAVISYVHNAAAPGLGKIGVLVDRKSDE